MSDMFPWFDQSAKLLVTFFAIAALAAASGCRTGRRKDDAEPSEAVAAMLSEVSAMGG